MTSTLSKYLNRLNTSERNDLLMANLTATVNVEGIEVIQQMQAELNELKAKVERMENVKTSESVSFDKLETNRDVVIEMAKRDIEELGVKLPFSSRILYRVNDRGCFVDFVVNHEKRTVVSLLKGSGTDQLISKGIAKCAPDDCFNSHLGRAISLRRALGLEVPSEYLSAPKPSEAKKGDVVRWNDGSRKIYEILSDSKNSFVNLSTGKVIDNCSYSYLTNGKNIIIIDDSREEVGE